MDVDVRIKIGANGEASTWRTIQVARPSDGSDYVTIPTPEVIKHGPGGAAVLADFDLLVLGLDDDGLGVTDEVDAVVRF